MFQYAFGKQLAMQNNTQLVLALSYIQSKLPFKKWATPMQYELDIFNLHTQLENNIFQANYLYPFAKTEHILRNFRNKQKLNVLSEKQFEYNPTYLQTQDNSYVIGNFQSEKYFTSIQDIIRKDFQFKKPLETENEQWKKKIENCHSISLHIRRGDYLSIAKNASKFSQLSLQYYQDAIKYISNKIEKPIFFIFSDDSEWVKANVKTDFQMHFIDNNKGKNNYRDMQLMSCCKHNIIANSTFSWWGAWLNNNQDKMVIAPNAWFADVSINSQDIIPSKWIKL